ncbi:MAG: twin transmembrane helix small protein [Gammaproteobacteria bacterium]|nr:MAG: twin transmembrane helix small protein [Gammaproteobacteria bacterium]
MTIFIKIIIVLFLIAIFFSLGSALYFLIHDKSGSTRIVKALTWRIGLSLLLFALLLVAFTLGWITPHSIT